MPKKVYFNWKLVVVLIIALFVLAVTAYSLRQWQRGRRAQKGLALGNKAFEEKDFQQAAKYLGQYISLVRDDVPVLLKYAQAQLNIRPLKQPNVQQAISAYRIALRTDKSNLDAAAELAAIYLELKMPGEAELIINRTIDASTNIDTQIKAPQLYRLLAIAMAQQRKYDEAIKTLKENIEKNPAHIPSYDSLGILARQRPEKFTNPVEYWYNLAVEKNPNSANAYIIRAAFYISEQEIQKALVDLESAENKDLSDPKTHLQLAEQLIRANALEKAEKHLQQIYQQTKDEPMLWKIWADLALRSESKAQMTHIADTALKELAPQKWDFLPLAVELYINAEQFEKAQSCINELKQKEILPPRTAFLEGLLAYHKADYNRAVSFWQQSIRLQNDSPEVRFRLAQAYTDTADTQSALMLLRSLVSEQPNMLKARLFLAEILTNAGKTSEAENQASMAVQLDPHNTAAALIYIQTQIQLLMNNQVKKDSQSWVNIKNNLASLEKALEDPFPARLLQLQVEMYQGNNENAKSMLDEMKATSPDNPQLPLVEAQYLITQNKTDEAIKTLQKAIDKTPQSTAHIMRLAAIYASENKNEQCEKLIKESLSRIDNPLTKRDIGLLLAKYYRQWQQQDKKYLLLNQLAEQLPDDIPVLRELLNCEQLQNNSESSQQLIDKIKSIEGEYGWQWQYEQAKLWFAQPEFKDYYTQIVSLLKNNLAANPDDQASRLLLASTYEKYDNLSLAVLTYRQALARSPDNINIIVPAVAALYKAKQYDSADQILQQAAQQKLTHPELTKLQLQAHITQGRLNNATEILEELLNQDPNNYSMCLTLALLKIKQNNFLDAEQLLEKLIAVQPYSLSVRVAQVELYTRQGNITKALDICNQLLDSSKSASAYILRARTFAYLGKMQDAEQDLNLATETEPDSVYPWTARCNFYFSTGNLEKALEDIQKAVQLQPENLQLQKTIIEILFASDKPQHIKKAKLLLDEALSKNPDDYDLMITKARYLSANQTAAAISQAISILEKIVEQQPQKAGPWLLLGNLKLKQNSIEAMDIALRALAHRPDDKELLLLKARCEAATSPALAIPTLKALCELDSNDINLLLYLADAQITAENYPEAINILENKIEQCKNDNQKQRLKTTLAVAMFKNGGKKQAISELESILISSPNQPEPLYIQAQLLCEDENFVQVMQISSNWIKAHPGDTKTPVTIARLLADTNKPPAMKIAETILQTVLDNHSDCTEALSTQAMLMQVTERPQEAAQLYQRLLNIEPENKVAINNMAWILCEHLQQYEKALELAQAGINEEPAYININYINLIDTRGMIYYRLGRFDDAIKDFNKCLDLYPPASPQISATYLHLAKTMVKTSQNDNALMFLKKALKTNDEQGGLSPKDVDEAQQLNERLSQGV
jgi:tetratricopeptide (TPR) repeat protein